jgi:spore coat protein U-like protein
MAKASKIVTLILLATLATAMTCFASTATISASATILTKNKCKFNANSADLAFGNLNPLTALDVTVSTTIDFVCNGSTDPATYIITDDDGLHETGPDANRMQHVAFPAQYLPYTFDISPRTGNVPKGVDQTLTVTGTVLGIDYQTALTGDYADTVTIAIDP